MLRYSLAPLLALLATPTLALAVPLQLAHQGRLLDTADAPLDGTHELAFRLYDASTGGSLLWEETVSETFTGGFYGTVLGADADSNPLDDGIFATPPIYLELTVDDGDPLLPRQEINSVPFALRAGTAENLEGGYVDASDVSIEGQLVIDADGNWVGPTPAVDWGELTGIPAPLGDGLDADTLAGLSCVDGGRPRWDGSSGLWACSGVSWTEISGIPVDVTEPDADTLGALASCADGGVAKFSVGTGIWECGVDLVLGTSEVLGYVDGATVALGPGSSMDGNVLATVDDLVWGSLVGVPPELADGSDADTLAVLGASCADGDRAAWDSVLGEWACVGEQVELGRIDGSAATPGQVLTFDGTDTVWADAETSPASPCTLGAVDADFSSAEVVCGAESIVMRTRSQFAEVSAGSQFACGVTTSGALRCWGDNQYASAAPPAGSFTQVDAGIAHACAIEDTGAVQCWGRDQDGETAAPAGDFVQVAAGNNHTCGITVSGELECWGRDGNGQASPPAGVFLQVSAGQDFTCGLESGGSIQCWGSNLYGRASPPGGTFTSLSTGDISSCAVSPSETLWCWGDSSYALSSPPPGQFTMVSSGSQHHCGLGVDGALTCWGNGVPGRHSPPPGTFGQVTAGSSFSCGLSALLGTARCWGSADYGQTAPP